MKTSILRLRYSVIEVDGDNKKKLLIHSHKNIQRFCIIEKL